MLMPDINLVSVLIAAVANMAIGAVWYSMKVFGRSWMHLIGKTEEDIKNAGNMGMSYVGMTIMAIILAYVLAYVMKLAGADTIIEGVTVAFWMWVGFVLATSSGLLFFERRPARLFLINNGYYLVSMAVMGAILSFWI